MEKKNEFYKLFTISSNKFINEELQLEFRNSNILIAGLGSIGNPIAMAAIRAGAENLTITDPDVVNIENLPRQQYTCQQIGKNKALATKENALLINPFATVNARSIGTTKENVHEQVKDARVIIDAIDIRSLGEIWELHTTALKLRKPVITGYDLAGTAALEIYRYDEEKIQTLHGKLSPEKINEFYNVRKSLVNKEITESEFMDYIYDAFSGPIKPLHVPVEQLTELLNRKDGDNRTYQLGTTSTALSALTIETIFKLLANEKIKNSIYIDIPSLVRKRNPSILYKSVLLMKALKVINNRSKKVNKFLSEK